MEFSQPPASTELTRESLYISPDGASRSNAGPMVTQNTSHDTTLLKSSSASLPGNAVAERNSHTTTTNLLDSASGTSPMTVLLKLLPPTGRKPASNTCPADEGMEALLCVHKLRPAFDVDPLALDALLNQGLELEHIKLLLPQYATEQNLIDDLVLHQVLTVSSSGCGSSPYKAVLTYGGSAAAAAAPYSPYENPDNDKAPAGLPAGPTAEWRSAYAGTLRSTGEVWSHGSLPPLPVSPPPPSATHISLPGSPPPTFARPTAAQISA